jgi:hypothetical protein
MLLNPRTGKEVRQFVQRKLIIRLRIFFFLFFILIDIIFYEISLYYISPLMAIGSLIFGFFSGLLFVRRKKIYWEEDTARVISKMDQVGIVLLVIYILFSATRHWLLHQWLQGNQLTAFSFSFAAGAMGGRLISMRRQIVRVLREQKII